MPRHAAPTLPTGFLHRFAMHRGIVHHHDGQLLRVARAHEAIHRCHDLLMGDRASHRVEIAFIVPIQETNDVRSTGHVGR